MDYENICRKIIFNFIIQMEDNLRSRHLFNFKILYNYMQTFYKNVSTLKPLFIVPATIVFPHSSYIFHGAFRNGG
jgi:hypothetical protein